MGDRRVYRRQDFTAAQLRVLAKTLAPIPHTVITSGSWTDLFGGNFDKDGDLWLADEHGALDELSHTQLAAAPTRRLLRERSHPPASSHPFFWPSTRKAIFEFTPTDLKAGGTLTPNITISGNLIDPGELAFDTDGNLWVASYGSAAVVEFAKSSIATSGSPTTQVVLSSTNDSLFGTWGEEFDEAAGGAVPALPIKTGSSAPPVFPMTGHRPAAPSRIRQIVQHNVSYVRLCFDPTDLSNAHLL
jgi:hypothetical protein